MPSIIATTQKWLLRISNVVSTAETLNLALNFSLLSLNLNNHIHLVATISDWSILDYSLQ